MIVNDIISLARNLTNTDSTQVSDSDALLYLNIVYHDIANRILTEVDERYFWDKFTTDTVAYQGEYILPLSGNNTEGISKLDRVEIKYSSDDTYRTLVKADTLKNYKKSDDWLLVNSSKSNPIYDIKDGSIFIYPEPTESIVGGLIISGNTNNIDLVLGGDEQTVFPGASELRIYHYLLSVGMRQYIYSSQKLHNQENDSINKYEVKVNKMIEQLKDKRSFLPIEQELPNSYYLKY